jgi:hypothetical protein
MKYATFDKNVTFVDGNGKHITHPWGKEQNPPKKKKVSKRKK